MYRNPMDIFDEMDEVFARLFSGMDREFREAWPDDFRPRIPVREAADGPEPGDPVPAFSGGKGPVAEVHRIGDEVMVIADLPGIAEEELRLDLRGTTLLIDAGDAGRHVRASATVPAVDRGSMRKTLKNGVLEVSFRVLPET